FSLDSIVTAIGMARDIEIMIAAVMIAVAVMYFASGAVAGFIAGHPTTKMLALGFLLMIGAALLADGFDVHIPRGYIYFAMAFAAAVERFNIVAGRRRGRGPRSWFQQPGTPMPSNTPVLIVAGGSRGIGAATAALAGRAGYDVAINYRRDANAAEMVANAVRQAGRRAITVQGDMAREADIAAMIA